MTGRLRYWVLAETPVDSPAERPSDVRGWVHYHDENGGAWGCRFTPEVETLTHCQALGFLEFFVNEAPRLALNQHVELFAGRQRMLVCDVLDIHEPTPLSRAASTPD